MFDTQLINSAHNWESRLEIEDTRRAEHRREAYVNYLAKPQNTHPDARAQHARAFLARLFSGSLFKRQTEAQPWLAAQPWPETQPQLQECCCS